MSSGRRPKYPELTLRINRQGEPSGPEDDRDTVSDLVEEDQRDIAAGRAVMVEVVLLRRDSATAIPQRIYTLFNRVGPPEVLGAYSHPEQIVDELIRRDATDMWSAEFVAAGDLVRWRDQKYLVEKLEDVDAEYAEVGYCTGYAFCRRIDTPPGGRCHPRRLRVDELVKVIEDSAATTTDRPVGQ